MIIKGWRLYPENVAHYSRNDVVRVWVVASEDLLRKRLLTSKGFLGVSNQAIENYLARSVWHNKLILSQCKMYKEPYTLIDEYVEKDIFIQRIKNCLFS